MVERQQEKYGWEFLFLGANIDAIAEAGRFGITAERAVQYECDSEGTAANYRALSETVSMVRCCAPSAVGEMLDMGDWKAEIEENYNKKRRR